MEELVLSASSSDHAESIYLWDLHSGTVLTTYKNNPCEPNTLSFLNRQIIVAPYANSATVHFWTWRGNQPFLKSSVPERLSSLQCSHDGLYIAGGGFSGTMYLWEVSSGALVRSWEGHYKKVSCLAFTDDDSLLISGGEDAIINCWQCAKLSQAQSDEVKPWHSWSQHSLAVTGLHCGVGGVNSRLVSCSLDRTCKVWDVASRGLIASVIFPSGLLCVRLDSAETCAFLGAVDGKIYALELFSARSVSDEGLSDVTPQAFRGHTKPVTSLSVSLDGSLLVSGSLDETCKVWQTATRQLVKTFGSHKGGVVSVDILVKGWSMVDVEADKKAAQPVKSLQKYASSTAQVRTAQLGHSSHSVHQTSAHLWQRVGGEEDHFRSAILRKVDEANTHGSSTHLESELAKLKASVTSLSEENAQWKSLNNQLYKVAFGQAAQQQ